MNEQELNEIEARAEAATPGPWFWDTNRRYKSTMLKAPQNGGTCVMDFTRWGMQSAQPRFNDTCASFGGILYTMEQYDKTGLPNPNADFIAHARQDVPALAAEVRQLQQRLGECEANDQLLDHLETEIVRLRAALEASEKVCKIISEYMSSGEFFDPETSKAIYEWQDLKGGNS